LKKKDENKAIMSKFATFALPKMFNVYTTELEIEKDSVRQTLLDTIKNYLQITDNELINTFLVTAVQNFEKFSNLCEQKTDNKVLFDFDKTNKDDSSSKPTDLNIFGKHSFMDLIEVLVKYSNEANASTVFNLAIKRISDQSADKTDQKKCYKILNALLSSGTAHKNQSVYTFIETKFQSIAQLFTSSLGKCNAAAKVPRLKCLIGLMEYVSKSEQKIFIRQLLPEIILCVKELNLKSREAAFDLLNSMLRLWQKLGVNASEPTTEIDSLYEFFHLIMVGLAGSTNMIACTCLALSSLAYEFKDNISGPLIGELIETACLLVKSEQKEITISSLNLLKMLCAIFTQTTLAQYLKQICEVVYNLHEKRGGASVTAETSFNNVAPVTKSQQIRSLVKLILKKLIKKFNYQLVVESVFACEKVSTDMIDTSTESKRTLTAVVKQGLEHLLTNIRKSIDKDKKRKQEEQNSDKKSSKDVDLISMYTTKTGKSTTAASKHNELVF